MKAKDMLIPFGKLYGTVTDVRNAFYDRGIFRAHRLGAKTISIGNITTGGTGKTPLTALVAKMLAEAGENVCILTRGYGRESKGRVLVSDKQNILVDARTGGDEPVELAAKLLGRAIVVADVDRVAAAAWAKENFNITAFVLDDGFQHRRTARNLDIVCIDTTDAWGNGHILPAGKLRENIKHIRRADMVVLTRTGAATSETEIADIEKTIRQHHKNVPVFRSRTVISGLHPLTLEAGTGNNKDLRLFAFSGIGNPSAFEDDLKRFAEDNNASILSSMAFRDHYFYDAGDIKLIEETAADSGANALVTTAKDAVKLNEQEFSMPCYVAEIKTVIDDPARFRDLVIEA